MLTIILQDPDDSGYFLFVKKESYNSPFDGATEVLESYFDKHCSAFVKCSPKKFLLYFHTEKAGFKSMDVTLSTEETTITKSIIGDPESGFEESFPYTYSLGVPKTVTEEEFPEELIVRLAMKKAGVNRIAENVRRIFEKEK